MLSYRITKEMYTTALKVNFNKIVPRKNIKIMNYIKVFIGIFAVFLLIIAVLDEEYVFIIILYILFMLRMLFIPIYKSSTLFDPLVFEYVKFINKINFDFINSHYLELIDDKLITNYGSKHIEISLNDITNVQEKNGLIIIYALGEIFEVIPYYEVEFEKDMFYLTQVLSKFKYYIHYEKRYNMSSFKDNSKYKLEFIFAEKDVYSSYSIAMRQLYKTKIIWTKLRIVFLFISLFLCFAGVNLIFVSIKIDNSINRFQVVLLSLLFIILGFFINFDLIVDLTPFNKLKTKLRLTDIMFENYYLSKQTIFIYETEIYHFIGEELYIYPLDSVYKIVKKSKYLIFLFRYYNDENFTAIPLKAFKNENQANELIDYFSSLNSVYY